MQILEPGDEAVAIAEADRRRGDAADGRFARGRLGIGPRREPRIRGLAGAGVQAIGDRGREHRQLVAPALDVRIALRDLGEGVPQVQPRRRALRLERDRDLRAARLRQLRAGRVTVGEDDAPRRIDLQHLAGHLDAVVVPDEHPSAGPRVDGGAGAPPRRPQRAVGEVLEDGVDGRADVDGAFEEMREGGHGCPLRGRWRAGGTGRAGTRAAPRLAQLGVQLEPPERVAPDALQLLPDRAERVAAGAVVAETALGADRHEPGVREGLQLQRHGAERDVGHRRVDVPRAPLLVPHQAQDLLAPGRGKHARTGSIADMSIV